MACRNFLIGTPTKNAIGNKTPRRNTSNATYKVRSSWKRFTRIPSPMCPTVYAMAAPTPIGAKYMIILVNLNITSERLSVARSMGWRLSSRTIASAIPKIILKTTICKTCPSAIDLAIFSGKICRIISLNVCGGTFSSSSWAPVGIDIPIPAFEILIAASPIKRAIVVTTSKYKIDFQPILPTCFRSECPAIPKTSVANNKGAIMVLIIFKKTLLKTWSLIPTSGKSCPISAPTTIEIKIQVVRDFFLNPYKNNPTIASHLENIKTSSGTFNKL